MRLYKLIHYIVWLDSLVIINSAVFAGDNAAAMTNFLNAISKTQMELCLHTRGCRVNEIRHCEKIMQNGLSQCNTILREKPNALHAWSECLTQYVDKELGEGSIIGFSLQPACQIENKPLPAHNGPQPAAQLPPKYFSTNSFDLKTLRVYDSKENACTAGAKQLQMIQQRNGSVEAKVSLAKINKTVSISGQGSTPYKQFFDRPVLKYGECTGVVETRFLKKFLGRKKGTIIKTNYKEDIYVIVDCSNNPKPSICD